MKMMKSFIAVIICIIVIIILLYIINSGLIDNFDNKYTNDICCNEYQKENCMKYGKTGVCNYNKNNNSCLCQNAYT